MHGKNKPPTLKTRLSKELKSLIFRAFRSVKPTSFSPKKFQNTSPSIFCGGLPSPSGWASKSLSLFPERLWVLAVGNGIPRKPITNSSFSIQTQPPLSIPDNVWKAILEDNAGSVFKFKVTKRFDLGTCLKDLHQRNKASITSD